MFKKLWLSPPVRLAAILALALLLRLYKISNPIGDWHAFRQADTASVTREYVKHGVDLLRPRYHDLANIQSGKDNLDGYRMVEFPIINAVIAGVLRAVPNLSLVVTSRVFSVVASLLAIVALYSFVQKWSGQWTAEVAALVMAVLPYSVYYSRAILPEPFMLAFGLGAIWAFDRWLDTQRFQEFLFSAVCLSLALLLKPFVIFLMPVGLVLLWFKWQWQTFLHMELIVYGLIAVAPTIAWRDWIQQFPSGVPASDWLFNGNGIRWRPAWFRWLGWERVTKLQLGYTGLIFLPGWLAGLGKDALIYGAWWLGIFIYLSVIATGNVQHDYYQVLMIPIVSISVAKGIVWTQRWLAKKLNPTAAYVIVGGVAALSWYLAWLQVKGYYQVNHWEYVEAGQAVDRLVPSDAKVIAPAFGDTQFLFQTNRTGWPIGFEIDDKIKKGATHYVTTSDDDEARMLKEKYQVIEQAERYTIIDLTKPKTL